MLEVKKCTQLRKPEEGRSWAESRHLPERGSGKAGHASATVLVWSVSRLHPQHLERKERKKVLGLVAHPCDPASTWEVETER